MRIPQTVLMLSRKVDECEPLLPGIGPRVLGQFATVDDAARAYDKEVRRRGWQGLTFVHFSAQRKRFLWDNRGCI
jgi:hypothetical protein